jgi:hypothetical protein
VRRFGRLAGRLKIPGVATLVPGVGIIYDARIPAILATPSGSGPWPALDQTAPSITTREWAECIPRERDTGCHGAGNLPLINSGVFSSIRIARMRIGPILPIGRPIWSATSE